MTSNTTEINREACAWIAKLHDGELSRADLEHLREWMRQGPEFADELRRMAKRWDEINVLTELAVPLVVAEARQDPFSPSYFGGKWAKIGAFATGMAIIFAAVAWHPFEDVGDGLRPTNFVTSVGEQQSFVLPDTSTVLLNTNSELRIDYGSSARDVYLVRGEAHFDAAHDPGKPFQVYAGNGITRAIGTSFSVYLKENSVEITVTDGSVEVGRSQTVANAPTQSGNTQEERPIVKAGQVAVFDQVSEVVRVVSAVDSADIDRRLAWQKGLLRFSGSPLHEVLAEVSRYTPQSIVILDPELRDLRIGAIFEVGQTEKMFEALESGFGVHVERVDDSLVYLSMAGTNP